MELIPKIKVREAPHPHCIRRYLTADILIWCREQPDFPEISRVLAGVLVTTGTRPSATAVGYRSIRRSGPQYQLEVFQHQIQVVAVGRAGLEVKGLVPLLGCIVFGMNQQGA